MPNALCRTVAVALLAGLPVVGFALDFDIYGTVNKATMVVDDGQDTHFNIVDVSLESTRFGFEATHQTDSGLAFSSLLEVEAVSNPSNLLTQNTTPGQSRTPLSSGLLGTNVTVNERIARVGAADYWGALFLGNQPTATDDVFATDTTAAQSVLTADIAAFGGGMVFRTEAAGVFTPITLGGTSTTIGGMALGNDGTLDNVPSVRYDTPTVDGVNASVSFAQGGDIDAALRYRNAYHGFTTHGAVGYKWVNSNATGTNMVDGQLAAALSIQHQSGFGATVAYTVQDIGNKTSSLIDDPTGWYVKLGYQWEEFGFGVDYSRYDDSVLSTTSNSMQAFGLGADWLLTEGVTLGALYRLFMLDLAGVNTEQDISVFALSLRVHF